VSGTERLTRPPARGKRGADQRAGQKAEGSGGLELLTRERQRGEPSLAGFGGVVFQGEVKPGKAW